MASTDRSKRLRKLDSAVVLERLDSNASAHCIVFLRQDTAPSDDTNTDQKETPVTPVGLDLSVRFGRIGALMSIVVIVLGTLTFTFNKGVVIGQFHPNTTDPDAQKNTLDKYNSYTGNVASIFGFPIEKFVTLAVNVVMLRVLTASLLRTEVSWKTTAVTLAISAGLGYLISNGLNALNVQLGSPTIEPIITATDLSYVPDVVASASAMSTNLSQSFSERSPRNPITNTALRNLVLPRSSTTKLNCQNLTPTLTVPDVVTEYGFAQRDWQSRVLQEALEPETLRITVNPTNNKTANDTLKANDLPMNASVAADLFVYSINLASELFGWPATIYFSNYMKSGDVYPNVKAAAFLGLLPPATQSPDESTQREWFLREGPAALTQQLNMTTNFTKSDVVMEFSHVEISPSMRFDAFTIEFEIDQARVANVRSNDNSTGYNNVEPEGQCGPWSMWCMMRNPTELAYYDPPAQVQVFATCADENGTEAISYDGTRLENVAGGLECPSTSNRSFIVLSIGKRFEAESVTQNKTINATGVFDNPNIAVVKNLRRIYTYTIGKFSWDPTDLAADFNAECSNRNGSCTGLRVPLTRHSNNAAQELIVGIDALPLNSLSTYLDSRDFLPLVQVHEKPSTYLIDMLVKFPSLSVDPLLPHNIGGNVSWDMAHPLPDPKYCQRPVAKRLELVVNNHWYIEHGLQTAYTAANFFLLQNAVVKDVVALNATHSSLNFQQNKQTIPLLASIPDQNAWLTLLGCVVMVLGFLAVLVWAFPTSGGTVEDRFGGLGHVSTPHVVARVILDSMHFPPMFLHRRVIGASGSDGVGTKETNQKTDEAPPSVEGFVIDGLTLQPPSSESTEAKAA